MSELPGARAFGRLSTLAATLVALSAGTAQAQQWRDVTSARQVFDRTPHEVQIRYGAGELRLAPAEAPMLYRMEMRYDERYFTPLSEYEAEKKLLRLGLEGREGRRTRNMREGSRATIELSREVPFDLELQFGAGEADIELGGLALRRLAISTGASDTKVRFTDANPIEAEQIRIESGAAALDVSGLANARARSVSFQGGVGSTTLDFGGEWTRSMTASVRLGVGAVVLRVPRGVGVRVSRSSFLSSFDSEGLIKRGNDFFSPDWETATHRLEISVNAAFGSVSVEWIG